VFPRYRADNHAAAYPKGKGGGVHCFPDACASAAPAAVIAAIAGTPVGAGSPLAVRPGVTIALSKATSFSLCTSLSSVQRTACTTHGSRPESIRGTPPGGT